MPVLSKPKIKRGPFKNGESVLYYGKVYTFGRYLPKANNVQYVTITGLSGTLRVSRKHLTKYESMTEKQARQQGF